MSYILDALRRAQAERERGQVPGLDARTVVATPAPRRPRRTGARWLGAGLVLVLVVLGAAAVLALRREPPAAPGVTQAAAPPVLPAPSALASAPPPAAPPAMVVVSAPQPASPGPAPVDLSAAAPAAPPPAAPAAPPTAIASSPVRAIQLAQLGAELRRELPALVLGGAIWSDSAVSRFVIVNGQVLREGDAAAPGVLLERIGPKAVFLRWRDWRIEVPI